MTLESLFGLRYGADHPAPADAPFNDVIATLLAHRSVRDYSSRPVSEAILQVLVAAAQSAASSSNLQLWSVVAVRDAHRKAALAAVGSGQKHIVQCPLFLAWVADHQRIATIAHQRGLAPDGLEYLEMLVMAVVDAALAAQNAVVAAESLGLGTVYIGGLRNDPKRVAEVLALPQRAFAVFGL
ncbi:MAG: nitroreductase family protein, partial [Polyangiaceae bacterium]|nr:nitroreductase family protein [Polyangiaceae bacterium]